MNLFKQGAQLVAFIIIITILFTGCNSASADLEKYEFYKGERSYEDLNPELQLNKAIAYKAVKDDPSRFKNLPAQLRGDLDIAFAAIVDIDNEEIILNNIEHILPSLWDNKNFVYAILKHNGRMLKHASENLRADKEVVLAGVINHGQDLYYASAKLKADKEIVLAAVNHDGNALRYASESLKSDKDVVIVAIESSGSALEFASESLKSDKEVSGFKTACDIINESFIKLDEKFGRKQASSTINQAK